MLRARDFGTKHLLGEGLRSLDMIARLGLNLDELDWQISHLEPA